MNYWLGEIGIIVEIIGAGFFVFVAYRTKQKLEGKSHTIDAADVIESTLQELKGQYKTQLVGFFIIFFGLVMQFVGGCNATSKPLSAKEEMGMRLQCQNMAKEYFDRDTLAWDKNKDNYTAHYDKKINKCIIKIDASVTNSRPEIYLYDVVENKQYGEYLALRGNNNMYPVSPDGKVKPYLCVVSDNKCKNQDEFEDLVKPYMEE